MFNVVVCCVVRFFFFVCHSVDVDDFGLLGCYTEIYIGIPTFRRNPFKIKALRYLETSLYANIEIQGRISEDLNPLPSMPAVCVCVWGGHQIW